MKIKNFITSMISIIVMGSLFCSINQKNGLDEQNININKAQSTEPAPEKPINPDFQIKMIDLKCKFGDSTLITYKDKHILIDAGGESISGNAIYNSIKDLNYIDYMIFTHADSDHIFNFSDKPTAPFEKWFALNPMNKIGTIIDFDIPEVEAIYKEKDKLGNDRIKPNYVEYKKYKEKLKNNKRLEKSINAKEAIQGENNGFFSLDQEKPTNGFRILNNYFYDHNVVSLDLSARRNNVSVCTLFEIDGYKHLFTGDLEEYESQKKENNPPVFLEGSKPYKRIYGESLLASLNYEYLKDGVVFYKAGHHGSDTSNSSLLMDLIRPRFIGVSCAVCKFKSDLSIQFPGQTSLYNMSKWTDYIYFNDYYVTESGKDTGNVIDSYYGDIIFNYYSNKSKEKEKFEFTSSELKNDNVHNLSINGTIDKLLLKSKRISLNIFSLGGESDGNGIFLNKNLPIIKKDEDYNLCVQKFIKSFDNSKDLINIEIENSNATYIKFGHIDILINFGSKYGEISKDNIDKVNKLCNDNILECLIICNNNVDCYSNLTSKNGLLKNTKIYQIDNIYHFGTNVVPSSSENKKMIDEILNSDQAINANVYTSKQLDGQTINVLTNNSNFDLSLEFLTLNYTDERYPTDMQGDYRSCSLMFIFKLSYKFFVNGNAQNFTYKYLNIGAIHDDYDAKKLLENNRLNLKNIDVVDLMSHGYISTSHDDGTVSAFNLLFNKIFTDNKEKFLFNGILNKNSSAYDDDVYSINNVYMTSLYDDKRNFISGNNILKCTIIPYDDREKDPKNRDTRGITSVIYGSRDINYVSSNLNNSVLLEMNLGNHEKQGSCFNSK